jgi:hypothetical protein
VAEATAVERADVDVGTRLKGIVASLLVIGSFTPLALELPPTEESIGKFEEMRKKVDKVKTNVTALASAIVPKVQ